MDYDESLQGLEVRRILGIPGSLGVQPRECWVDGWTICITVSGLQQTPQRPQVVEMGSKRHWVSYGSAWRSGMVNTKIPTSTLKSQGNTLGPSDDTLGQMNAQYCHEIESK